MLSESSIELQTQNARAHQQFVGGCESTRPQLGRGGDHLIDDRPADAPHFAVV